MTTPKTEQDFNAIFKGIKSKVDFKKLLKLKNRKMRFKQFKQIIRETNLRSLKETNKNKLFSFFEAQEKIIVERDIKLFRQKKELTKTQERDLKDFRNFLDTQKKLTLFEKNQISTSRRTLTREKQKNDIAELLTERGFKLKFVPERKGDRGRAPKKSIVALKGVIKGKIRFAGTTQEGREIKVIKTIKNRFLVFQKGKRGIVENFKVE